jgi:hypothetical protein
MSDVQRGWCPECKRYIRLKKDGTLRHHGGPEGSGMWNTYRSYCCKGVGEKPAHLEATKGCADLNTADGRRVPEFQDWPQLKTGDARWMALMSPDKAEPLALWLRAEAAEYDKTGICFSVALTFADSVLTDPEGTNHD